MHRTVTSPQNPRVKGALRLRSRRAREQQNRTVVDGIRELSRAVDAGVALAEVFVCPQLCDEECRRTADRIEQSGGRITFVSPRVFARLAFGDRSEGIVAVAEIPRRRLDSLRLPDAPLLGVVESVEKPGNLGAVIRSADGAGLAALILADAVTDAFNPGVIRASLGAVFHLPVVCASGRDTREWLTENQFAVYAATVGEGRLYSEVSYRGPVAIVLGSESRGLSPIWRTTGVTRISLPMKGAADSLNVSATAAVLFYEAQRQRSG